MRGGGSVTHFFCYVLDYLLEGEGVVLDVAAVGADHEVELAGLAVVDEVGVVELEQVGGDGEGDLAALTGLEGDSLKALEFLHGTCDASHHVADVELDDFCSGAAASVGDCDASGNLVVAVKRGTAQRVTAERERAIAEGCVTQPVAEGE